LRPIPPYIKNFKETGYYAFLDTRTNLYYRYSPEFGHYIPYLHGNASIHHFEWEGVRYYWDSKTSNVFQYNPASKQFFLYRENAISDWRAIIGTIGNSWNFGSPTSDLEDAIMESAQQRREFVARYRQAVAIAADIVPVWSFAKGLEQLATGRDLSTNESLGALGYFTSTVQVAAPFFEMASAGSMAARIETAATGFERRLLSTALAEECFPADTPVATEFDLKPIQFIQAGDQVWGYDLTNREWVLRPVVQTYEHDYEGNLVAVIVDGQVIEATSNHPFWVVEGQGLENRERPEHVPEVPPDSRTPGRWVDAANLQVGDLLLVKSGQQATVSHLAVRQVCQKVYNIQVAEVHSYAVGAGQALVHNKPVPSMLGPSFSTSGGVWDRVLVPESYSAQSLTPGQIASRLPVWAEGEAAHGALVVDGRIYLMTTDPTGRANYATEVVPEQLVGELGFTARNFNHIEAQSAAILRVLEMDGVNVGNAYVVVNRPFICVQDGQGCLSNLNRMLPPGIELGVYGATGQTGANRIVLFQRFRGQ
jgi:hypothetical protein